MHFPSDLSELRLLINLLIFVDEFAVQELALKANLTMYNYK